jgi:hypothetical protein
MTDLEMQKEVLRLIAHYSKMRETMPGSSMYRESMYQYVDMANGKDADDGNGTNIRKRYYKGYPDDFFLQVLSGLGELELYMKSRPDFGYGIP